MSRIREWIEECFSKELRDVPQKPKGAIHVIVYDSTQVPAAGAKTIGDRVRSVIDPSQSLTFWWKLGSFLDQAIAFADYAVDAASWEEAFAGIEAAVEKETAKGKGPVRIASLQFWGHGSPGRAYMGSGPALSTSTMKPGGPLHDAVRKVAGHLHDTQGHVWFRCCAPFQGSVGHEFAKTAATTFSATVVGHTFLIHALQSGTRVLRQGAQPDWDTDEGIDKRGKDKGELELSGPLRVRTVSMFRLYPPLDPGKLILPAGLTAAVARGLSKFGD